MQRITLEVKPRDLGKKEKKPTNYELRTSGWIPGIVYGHGAPVSICIDKKLFDKSIHAGAGLNALFDVKLGAETSLSIIKDVQRDIFTQEPIHIDFMRISVKEKITVNVPIHIKGEAKGVKLSGGILELIQREIQIRCFPDAILAHVEVDVTNLDLHQTIKVKDLNLGEKVEVLTSGDHMVANVVAPKVEEAPAPTVVEGIAAAAEPEVIAKGKKEEVAEGEEKKPSGAQEKGAAGPAKAAGAPAKGQAPPPPAKK